MPIVVRPEPPLPMSVAIASRAYGSEASIALIGYYRENPGGSQRDASDALDLPQQLVSRNLLILVQAGVVVAEPNPTDKRLKAYSVDVQRARELLSALTAFILGDD